MQFANHKFRQTFINILEMEWPTSHCYEDIVLSDFQDSNSI